MSTPRRRRTQSGGSMVEVSLCLVPFLMFLFGTISLGHAMFAYNNVSFLAREGSRWASVRGSGSAAVAKGSEFGVIGRGMKLTAAATVVLLLCREGRGVRGDGASA